MSNNAERTLLLVDDEENILSSLTRLFRREGYKILRANSGSKGIEILKENSVGVIVSDQRMPEMTGVEFLSEVKLSHPDTIRIVLSGYTDLKSITDAINDGAVYKFLTKPWDDEQLKSNVAEAFERYELIIENSRLNEEVKVANASLEKINEQLNVNVDKKTEEAALNMSVLKIAQEVLENMPVGIIGVSDDGFIAITNRLTEQWLANGSGPLIGSEAKESLPGSLYDIYKTFSDDEVAQTNTVTLDNSLQLEIRSNKMGKSSASGGSILVLTKVMNE